MTQESTLHCNAAKKYVTMKDDHKGYGMAWYHTEGVAYNMSISNVKKKNQVSYESATDDIFIVHRSNRVFSPDKGLICPM